MNLFSKLANSFNTMPLAASGQIAHDAVAEALASSPTLEGPTGPDLDVRGMAIPSNLFIITDGWNNTAEPEKTIVEKHAEIAARLVESLTREEAQLVADIETLKTNHATDLARLETKLAETRRTVAFYATAPAILSDPEPAAPVKPVRPAVDRIKRRIEKEQGSSVRRPRSRLKPPAPVIPPAPVETEPASDPGGAWANGN